MAVLAPMTLILLAEVTTPLDALGGAPAWVGTGLLGSVLGWLLFLHLPNKDKQIAGLIESRDAAMKALAADYRASLMDLTNRFIETDKERRDDYKQSLQVVVNHCEKETAMTNDAIRKDLGEMSSLAASLRQLVDELRAEIRQRKGP
jgi:hypothetical protein